MTETPKAATPDLTDSEKLLVLAAWFDMWDAANSERRQAILVEDASPARNDVQRDLRRMADEMEAADTGSADLRFEVRPNDDGTIDEVLIYRAEECVFHLEQMDDDAYWFAWYGDGMDRDQHFDIHRHGKRVTITDRAAALDAKPGAER